MFHHMLILPSKDKGLKKEHPSMLFEYKGILAVRMLGPSWEILIFKVYTHIMLKEREIHTVLIA